MAGKAGLPTVWENDGKLLKLCLLFSSLQKKLKEEGRKMDEGGKSLSEILSFLFNASLQVRLVFPIFQADEALGEMSFRSSVLV